MLKHRGGERAGKVFKVFNAVARVYAEITSFGWRPDEAYLEGKREKAKKEKKEQ